MRTADFGPSFKEPNMNLIFYRISMLIACFTLLLTLNNSMAATEQAPAAAQFYPFEGNWKGNAELVEPGNPPIKLNITFTCRKVSAGWAVACDMNAKNKDVMMSESDLMGVDPNTGKGHWYAITNQGETHDHQSEWTDSNTMKAQHAWKQEGKQMEEKVVFNFKTKDKVDFHSVVTVDGNVAGEFTGSLKK